MLLIDSHPKYNHDLTCWNTYQGEEGFKLGQDEEYCVVGCDREVRKYGGQDKVENL